MDVELPYTAPSYRGCVKRGGSAKIVAIAASTGGPPALAEVLQRLPKDFAPTLVVQHITSGFTQILASQLDLLCPMKVKEAADGDLIKQGEILVAPADHHMRVAWHSGYLTAECFHGNKLHGVMPAADILFSSIADRIGGRAVGVILTGMGEDGAAGLKRMREAGAHTIGQNRATCVVYGMPKKALEMGAVEVVAPLNEIADKIIGMINM